MSGEDRREGAPQGPPWSLDVVADFHAGTLDAATTERLRPRLHEDGHAREVLAALDATREELATTAVSTIPDDVAVRIETSLADEVQSWGLTPAPGDSPEDGSRDGGTVVDFDTARRRSHRGGRANARRRYGWGAALVAAAAAVVLGVVVLGTPILERTGGKPQAIEPKAPAAGPSAPLALQGETVSLTGEQLSAVLGSEEYTSSLSDPTRLIACLKANGIDSGNPIGAREVTVNGQPAQLLVLSTGQIGTFRLLAVGPQCGPGNPATMSDTTIGG